VSRVKASNLWASAQSAASRTPESRNRYVDFLRAFSICSVVFGHWLMSLPMLVDGLPVNPEVLRVIPWTQWLTWAFQVMPIFFFVGGYSNAVSWRSAMRKGNEYGVWLATRMSRLVRPIVPLLLTWILLALLMRHSGIEHAAVRDGSRAALIPVWFLAVYILVTTTTPLAVSFYKRFGTWSFGVFLLAAAAIDLISFSIHWPGLRWVNYGFIWLAVHQLGILWQDEKLSNPRHSLTLSAGALVVMSVLINVFGYPFSMLTVPGEAISNSRPPTLALLALGVFHVGLLVCLESPARRWLKRAVPWQITILINSRIMTLFLWHLTVMVLLVALAMATNSAGLEKPPGEDGWWLIRVAWLVGQFAILLVFIGLFGRFEHPGKIDASAIYPAWRLVFGAFILSFGLALLVTGGISGTGPTGLRLSALLPTLLGVALVLTNFPTLKFRQ